MQLDATDTVPGSFAYSPETDTVLDARQGQILSVVFTPTDSIDYASAAASVLINVTPAPLSITVNAASKVYGQPNPTFSVSYNGFVNGDTARALAGTLSFSTAATPASDVGSYDIAPSGLSASNYSITYTDGSLSVTPADQTIAWSNPADIIYGTPLGAEQLNATVTGAGPAPAGALNYSTPIGTVLAGEAQTLTVVAAATLDYNEAMTSVLINVAPAALTVTVNARAKSTPSPTQRSVSRTTALSTATPPTRWAVASRSPRRQLPIATWALTTSPRAGSPRATTPSHTRWDR